MREIKRSFSGGEVTQTMPSRDDLELYAAACSTVRNFTVHTHGSARYRSGLQYLVDAIGYCVLIPFEFNSEEEDMNILVFSALVLDVMQDDGYVVGATGIVTPYLEEELIDIKFAQLADAVYLTHVNHAPRKLVRLAADSWVLSVVDFVSAIDPPTSGLSAVFTGTPDPGGFTQRYKVTSLTELGEESVGSAVFGAAAKPRSEWVTGDHMTLSWTAVPGAEEYFIYKEYGGFYGFVGAAVTNTFRDDNFISEDSLTPPIDNNPFTGDNHPGAVAFHEQRLWFAGSNQAPNTFYGSNTGGFENFTKSRPVKPDDSVQWSISSNIDQVKWLASFLSLLIGTAGAEHSLKGLGGSIQASNPLLEPQSYWGSSGVSPIIVGNSLLHVQRQKSYIRDLSYSQEQQGYSGNDLTVLAEHLFEGHKILAWAYQRVPSSIVWAVRDDGILLGMTYLKEHGIWGWHRHDTDGLFEHITVIGGDTEDRVYASVNQKGTRRIVRIAPKWKASDGLEYAFFVDMGVTQVSETATTLIDGLEHLEGKTVSILADGGPIMGKVVVDGEVTLDNAANVRTVGLPYTGILAPLPFEATLKDQGTTQGEIRSFGNVKLRVLDTVGGSVAAGQVNADIEELSFDPFEYTQENWSEAIPLKTGSVQANPQGALEDMTTYVKQDQPLPITVLAITAEVDHR